MSASALDIDLLPALVCAGVRHRFGDHAAVDGVDLSVQQGELFGLLGPNGAGKTTLIRLLNTQLPLQEGAISVEGYDVRRSPMAIRRVLGYVPQQLSIEAALTGRENVAWFARLFDVPRRERKARVADALETMGLSDAADRLAGTYSGGMVRRLELAQALVNRPALLVARRADRRPRPDRTRRRVATRRGAPERHRHDRTPDDALHGGSRCAL
jgi:ABC-2 type transport system ATP-binding protein